MKKLFVLLLVAAAFVLAATFIRSGSLLKMDIRRAVY